jgi:hypothetical protein
MFQMLLHFAFGSNPVDAGWLGGIVGLEGDFEDSAAMAQMQAPASEIQEKQGVSVMRYHEEGVSNLVLTFFDGRLKAVTEKVTRMFCRMRFRSDQIETVIYYGIFSEIFVELPNYCFFLMKK